MFLGNVTFSGWDYLEPPPAELAGAHRLQADPWVVFCGILERAKKADYAHVDKLQSLCRSDDTHLRQAAQYLLACVGRQEQLQALDADILSESGAYRMEAADHAAISGSLRFIDTFIAGYRLAFGETTRMAMEEGLANLLPTDLESQMIAGCLLADDRAAGEAKLRALGKQQREKYGPRTSFYQGEPLRVQRIVADIDALLAEGDPGEAFASLQSLVTRLQSLIGFSQRGMFDEASGSWDETLIRRQLRQAERRASSPGLRTFFGHPAPL